MRNSIRYPFCFVALLFLFMGCNKSKLTVHLDVNSTAPQIDYGIEKLKELEKSNAVIFLEDKPDLTIRTRLDSVNLIKEAYKIIGTNEIVEIIGGDPVGIMYAW